MEEWVKVHEEMIVQQKEDINEQKIWLNDILDDHGVPYKNEFEYRDLRENYLEYFRHAYVVSVYVHKINETYAKELIQEYNERNNIEFHPEIEHDNNTEDCISDNYIEEKQIEENSNIEDGTAVKQLIIIIFVLAIIMAITLAYCLREV